MKREDVVTSPLEVHEKMCVHYRRQLMRGWPHAKIMNQFSDVRCGLVVLWKRGRKFTGGYSEAKLKVCFWAPTGGHACHGCTCTCNMHMHMHMRIQHTTRLVARA